MKKTLDTWICELQDIAEHGNRVIAMEDGTTEVERAQMALHYISTMTDEEREDALWWENASDTDREERAQFDASDTVFGS